MTVVGISMVKNEADIIAPVLAHMAVQVDHIVISDNLSTDNTREILDSLAEILPMHVLTDDEPGYFQSRKMSWLSKWAYDHLQADWVVPFDADEIWYHPTMKLSDALNSVPDEVAIMEAELYDHMATALDPDDDNPITRLGWRRKKPLELKKVAVRPMRAVTIHQGNHGANYAAERYSGLVIRHFPYRSVEQFTRKAIAGAAAYGATDLPESWGAHWRQWGALHRALGDDALHEIFNTWYFVEDPRSDNRLIYDPAPV